jgi:hypothetical protein
LIEHRVDGKGCSGDDEASKGSLKFGVDLAEIKQLDKVNLGLIDGQDEEPSHESLKI